MKKSSISKRFVALLLVMLLTLTVMPVVSAETIVEEFQAVFAAYFDESVNAELGSWPDANDHGWTINFMIGQEATISIDFGVPTAFNGPFAAVNTNFPIDRLGSAQITSFLLDGEDVPLAAQFINNEGIDYGVRLTLGNTWNPDIPVQPVDLAALGEFTTLEVTFVVATAGAYTARFGAYLDDDVNENVGSWPDMTEFGGEIEFLAGEEATITLTFPEPVAFNGPFAAIETDFPFSEEVDGEIIALMLDGVEFPLVAQFVNQEGLGEGDDRGVRLTLANTWNDSIPVQPMDLSALPEFTVLEVTFVIRPTGGVAFVPEPIDFAEFDPYGTFMAYMGIQTENWTFRNGWTEGSYGLYGSGWDSHAIGNNFFGLTGWEDGEAVVRPGDFTDVTIAGNGRYRVALTGFDFADSEFMRMLFISTNIPNTGDVEISNVRVVTGRVWENNAEFLIPVDAPYVEIQVLNQHDNFEVWNNAIPEAGGEIYIEFTISGFAFGEEIIEEEEEEQVFEPTPLEEREDVDLPEVDDDGGLPTWALILVIAGGAVVVLGAVLAFVFIKKKKA